MAVAVWRPTASPDPPPELPERMFFDLDTIDETDERERALADDAVLASCPYCAAEVEVLLDPGGAAEQEYVEDCEVCCRPWSVRVTWYDGDATVELRTEDDV